MTLLCAASTGAGSRGGFHSTGGISNLPHPSQVGSGGVGGDASASRSVVAAAAWLTVGPPLSGQGPGLWCEHRAGPLA
jgi:hypothetical protein